MNAQQLYLENIQWQKRASEEILRDVRKLYSYYKQGLLGGEKMPEDANPGLPLASKENFHYFTLPMALNYQRNSYKLWEAALLTYNDPATRFVFEPAEVTLVQEDVLRDALTKHKVALQPMRHTLTWRTLCTTIVTYYQGDIRNLFLQNQYDIEAILQEIQVGYKKNFPYLSGQKIANYWLYVLHQYTDVPLRNRHLLSVAPDTHVLQASIILGLVQNSSDLNVLQLRVAQEWKELLGDTELCPIDIHTPLWLWSRNNFLPSLS